MFAEHKVSCYRRHKVEVLVWFLRLSMWSGGKQPAFQAAWTVHFKWKITSFLLLLSSHGTVCRARRVSRIGNGCCAADFESWKCDPWLGRSFLLLGALVRGNASVPDFWCLSSQAVCSTHLLSFEALSHFSHFHRAFQNFFWAQGCCFQTCLLSLFSFCTRSACKYPPSTPLASAITQTCQQRA